MGSLWKQKERQSQIDSLPTIYSTPLSLSEEKIHALSISQLVSGCRSGAIAPSAVMMAYAKKTLVAQHATNCVTDIMFDEALSIPSVANWGPGVDSETQVNEAGTHDHSLLGVPVSIKGILSHFHVEERHLLIASHLIPHLPPPLRTSQIRLILLVMTPPLATLVTSHALHPHLPRSFAFSRMRVPLFMSRRRFQQGFWLLRLPLIFLAALRTRITLTIQLVHPLGVAAPSLLAEGVRLRLERISEGASGFRLIFVVFGA